MYPDKWVEGKPLVSVIAICHNHARFVVETLDSIRLQTYPNIELIIINNLKDECEEIINDWILINKINVRFIQNESTLNTSENVNLGVNHSSGKYLQIISCDDIILPSKIECQVKVFESLLNDCACVFSDYQKIDERGMPISNRNHYLGLKDRYFLPEEMQKILSRKPFVALHASLIRRSAFIESGGVNPKYEIEDYYLWLLLTSRGYSFYLHNRTFVKYRILRNSLWNSRGLKLIEKNLLIRLEFLEFLYKNNTKNFKGLFYSITHYIRAGGNFSEKRFLEVMKAINFYSKKYHQIIIFYNIIQGLRPRFIPIFIFKMIDKYYRVLYLSKVLLQKIHLIIKSPSGILFC
ncbi:MAG: hypothetical protein KatS3mg032_0006 [Cyclobacteriaceae bacterium]|nr:MAG: hypothetical protein KatS3mg032_0006 [Cyclobacteriaceae bacterium]